MDSNERNPTIMGKYSEYEVADFLDFEEERVDIFIQNNDIFVMTALKRIHGATAGALINVIYSALDNKNK